VLPGEHKIAMKYLTGEGQMFGLLGYISDVASSRKYDKTITLTVERGCDYTIRYVAGGNEVRYWVEDRQTGTRVSQDF
jgi:hypothetical protein